MLMFQHVWLLFASFWPWFHWPFLVMFTQKGLTGGALTFLGLSDCLQIILKALGFSSGGPLACLCLVETKPFDMRCTGRTDMFLACSRPAYSQAPARQHRHISSHGSAWLIQHWTVSWTLAKHHRQASTAAAPASKSSFAFQLVRQFLQVGTGGLRKRSFACSATFRPVSLRPRLNLTRMASHATSTMQINSHTSVQSQALRTVPNSPDKTETRSIQNLPAKTDSV